jgi:hypothetical protein
MKNGLRAGARIITAVYLCLGVGSSAYTQPHSSIPDPAQKELATMTHASGTFEVQQRPQAPDEKAEGSTLDRLSIDKQFKGDLEAKGKGEMLTAGTDLKGSAGQQLDLTVVPDSGAGQLVGLSGKMAIKLDDRKAFV